MGKLKGKSRSRNLTKPYIGTKLETAVTPRVEVFVDRYLVHLNGRRAAVEAGFSPASARQIAHELLEKPEIQAAVAKAMAERSERTKITQDQVLKQWWDLANADPRDLIELHRVCCRYCWGKECLYQRTPAEMRDELDKFERLRIQAEAAQKGSGASLLFNKLGGSDYDHRMDPNEHCPECRGAGVARVVVKDIRDLSPSARLLYAGIKQTKDNIEVKMRSQDEALKNVAQHLGMLKQYHKFGTGEGGDDDESQGFVLIPARKKRKDGIGSA